MNTYAVTLEYPDQHTTSMLVNAENMTQALEVVKATGTTLRLVKVDEYGPGGILRGGIELSPAAPTEEA